MSTTDLELQTTAIAPYRDKVRSVMKRLVRSRNVLDGSRDMSLTYGKVSMVPLNNQRAAFPLIAKIPRPRLNKTEEALLTSTRARD
jgi:hypothetical protein